MQRETRKSQGNKPVELAVNSKKSAALCLGQQFRPSRPPQQDLGAGPLLVREILTIYLFLK